MFYLFFGSDQIKVRQEAHDFIDSVREEEQVLVKVDSDEYENGQLLNLSSGVVLFGLPPLYVIDTPSLNDTFYEELLNQLGDLSASAQTFIIIETDLNAQDKKTFAKHAKKINEYKKATATRFNAFSLADALARKDKRLLWILLQEARQNNLSAEEIIGILWWQIKTIRLAARTKTAVEAGVKEFPYNKAKRALAAFKKGELEKISAKLLSLYHDGHSGKKNIDLALEEWVLSI